MKILLPRLSLLLALSILLAASTLNGTAQEPAAERRASQQRELQEAERVSQDEALKRVPSLACCECLGKVVTLDLSTGQGGPQDPLWLMNGGPAYTTPPYPGWITTIAARWIQPAASPLPSANIPPGAYRYTVRFNVPKCTIPMNVRLDGRYAADNSAQVLVDGNPVTSCPPSYCFKAPVAPVPFSATIATPGVHTLEINVRNEGGPSGLVANVQLTGQCKKEPTQ